MLLHISCRFGASCLLPTSRALIHYDHWSLNVSLLRHHDNYIKVKYINIVSIIVLFIYFCVCLDVSYRCDQSRRRLTSSLTGLRNASVTIGNRSWSIRLRMHKEKEEGSIRGGLWPAEVSNWKKIKSAQIIVFVEQEIYKKINIC